MPEGAEVETETLHETIRTELEHDGGSFLKRIALTTAILAAFAAVASLRAGATVNEALLLKTEAARLQTEVSDEWAHYQAKSLKAAVQEAAATSWLAIGKEPPGKYLDEQKRYKEEQIEIRKKAEATERRRDEKSKAADELIHHHHGFASAVALFQVSIVLGAVAALTRNHLVWLGSMGLGLAGIVLFAKALFG